MTFDTDELRARFPTLARKTYLNSGSHGLLAREVRAAFEDYLTSREQHGSDWPEWTRRCDALRGQVAQLLNAREDEIAITASASAGINSLASALDFSGARDKVLVSDFEFPTSAQIWHAQERRGARIEHVPEDSRGYLPLEHFERAIDERTKLVAIAHVCFRNGAKLDVAAITKLAHSRGALVLLDCFQSVGVTRVDVRNFDVDFAVGGMLKYLLGTAGIGFLFCRRDHVAELVPTQTGWFAQAAGSMMDIHHSTPAPDAQRFQAGTPPVPNGYAAAAGLDIILGLGVEAIESHVRQLTALCMDRLIDAGAQLATPREDARRGPTVAIRSTDCEALVARLAALDIVTSSRDGNVRAMFHCYNNEADVETFLQALLANRELLR